MPQSLNFNICQSYWPEDNYVARANEAIANDITNREHFIFKVNGRAQSLGTVTHSRFSSISPLYLNQKPNM